MARISGYFLLGFCFVLLQTTIFPRILPFNYKPDLLLILIIYLGLNERYVQGGLLAYALGSLQDVFAGHFPGLFGLVQLVTFLSVRGAMNRLNTESSLLLLVLVFAGTFVQGGLVIFSVGYFADVATLWPVVLRRIVPQALLNLGTALLLMQAVFLLQNRVPRRWRVPGLQKVRSRHEL